MPRYEFSEGSSNKFWDIRIEGTSVITTYGKIGSDGQSTVKEYNSADQAQKEYDKLIASKVKKGYQAAGDGAGATATKKAAGKVADAKPAAAKGAKADKAAEPAPAPSRGGQRYEFSEAGSNKFWEIRLEGSSVVTTYGRIGTEGQSTVKEYDDETEARKEHDKLVASKVKKGYALVGGGPATGGGAAATKVKAAANPELEKAIIENPEDDEAFLVYADWLQAQGDPRGELITLQNAAARKKDKKLQKAADALLEKHGAFFVPPRLAEMLKLGEKADWEDCHYCKAKWRNGFLQAVQLGRSGEDDPHSLEDLVHELFTHPSAKFLTELKIGALGIYDEYEYSDVVSAIAKGKPQCLRKLFVADYDEEDSELSWGHIGNLGKIWPVTPRLEEVTVRGGDFTLGSIDLPRLKSFTVWTGGFDKASLKSVQSAKWPQLETLKILLGDDNYGGNCDLKSLKPLLDGNGLGRLKHLGLMNCAFGDELGQALPGAKILGQLETLDLSLGTLSDAGAEALVAHKEAFKHLKELDLSDNFLTKKGIASVKGLCAKVIATDMKTPYDWDEDGRYVSVGE